MAKKTTSQTKRLPEVATRVKRTAELHGVSKRQVYRVIKGEKFNEEILTTYMFLAGEEENMLVKAAKELVHFN